jgi:uncharacterized protein (TIGR02678 family)
MTTTDPDLDDLQRAARTLLTRPLLRSGGPDAAVAAAIRRPAVRDRLQQWFDQNLGWKLIVDRDVIRLNKVPSGTPCQPGDAPSQEVCVLYCLVLAALEEAGEQIVITEIADAVAGLSGVRSQLPTFDQAKFGDRRRLISVLRLMVAQGVLVPTADSGVTEQGEVEYLAGSGNAIYDVEHRAAALMLSCPVPPTRSGTPAGMLVEPVPETVSGYNRRRRHAIMRRLVDEPVLYFEELSDEERMYFRSQRHALVREIEEMLETRVEIRSEGAAIIDDELSDLRFPHERTAQFAALLLAEALAAEVLPGAEAGHVVSSERLYLLATEVAAKVQERVKSIEAKPVTPQAVIEVTVSLLAALRLVEPVPDGTRLLGALGRYRLTGHDA